MRFVVDYSVYKCRKPATKGTQENYHMLKCQIDTVNMQKNVIKKEGVNIKKT